MMLAGGHDATSSREGVHLEFDPPHAAVPDGPRLRPLMRGLHSSTFRLNVSTCCEIRWVV
jgi:hypothetical protein